MKIILLQGLPASGKTTWANEYVKEHASFRRISKDDIREQIKEKKTENTKLFEALVIEEERKQVREAMQTGVNLIIDNTHLLFKRSESNPHIDHYKAEAEKYGYQFELKPFYIDILDAMFRDAKRENPVGVKVYERFLDIYVVPSELPENPVFLEDKKGLPTAVIVDIDGTIAFMRGKRSPYDYSKVSGDELNIKLKQLISSMHLDSDSKLFIVSGRKDDCRNETLAWLKANNFGFHSLFMRKSSDTRSDDIVKKEIYEEHIKNKYNVLAVFDDRDRVVKMWRKEGLPTYQVYYGPH